MTNPAATPHLGARGRGLGPLFPEHPSLPTGAGVDAPPSVRAKRFAGSDRRVCARTRLAPRPPSSRTRLARDPRHRGYPSPETPAVADTPRPETAAIVDSRTSSAPTGRPAIMKLRPVL